MKARIKETGEVLIVEEVSDKHVYVKIVDESVRYADALIERLNG